MTFNKINIFSNINFKTNIKNITIELNNLLKDADTNITQMLKLKNITTRTRKLTFTDALCYKFQYAQKYKTQKNIIDDYKLDHNIICNNTSFYKKENKIPLEYYDNIYNNLVTIFNKYTKNTNYKIISVDGTYNNTNYKNNKQLETSLNMGYFDISNDVPLEIDINKKQNTEIASFMDAILTNKIETDNIIFVCDRGYFSYDLFNLLNNRNAKFVIRIKNNSKCINKNINLKNTNIKNISNNIRFINYNFNKQSIRKLYNKKTRQYEQYKITQTVNCNIATNLDDTYSDIMIKEIYNSRWNIEEYFKLIKSNFKFAIMREHNKNTLETYKKTYTIIKIYSVLEKIFDLMCDNITEGYSNKYNVKINKTALINGLFKIIPDIIFSTLKYEKMIVFFYTYIHLNFCKKDIHNERVSKTPFTKWYVKDYHNKYDIEKLFEVYNSDNTYDSDDGSNQNKINKNLKSKLKNYTFEKINC